MTSLEFLLENYFPLDNHERAQIPMSAIFRFPPPWLHLHCTQTAHPRVRLCRAIQMRWPTYRGSASQRDYSQIPNITFFYACKRN